MLHNIFLHTKVIYDNKAYEYALRSRCSSLPSGKESKQLRKLQLHPRACFSSVLCFNIHKLNRKHRKSRMLYRETWHVNILHLWNRGCGVSAKSPQTPAPTWRGVCVPRKQSLPVKTRTLSEELSDRCSWPHKLGAFAVMDKELIILHSIKSSLNTFGQRRAKLAPS